MAEPNRQSLDAAVEETIELAHQAFQETRAEIARSQALSQAEADLAQALEGMIDDHDGGAHEQSGRGDCDRRVTLHGYEADRPRSVSGSNSEPRPDAQPNGGS
jgi:hypothetical protein